MAESKSKEKGKNIWSRMTLDKLVAAIASLNKRVVDLKHETWRSNAKTSSASSLWSSVIEKLKLDNSERTRHSLYNIWNGKRYNIDELVEKKKSTSDRNDGDGDDGNVDVIEKIPVQAGNNLTLHPDPSLPLPSGQIHVLIEKKMLTIIVLKLILSVKYRWFLVLVNGKMHLVVRIRR
jgi:hypothetical protein